MAKSIKVQEVKPNDVIFELGRQWIVKSNTFDPEGNTGNQPRHILTCDCLDKSYLSPYAKDMTFGKLIDSKVTLY